MSTPPSSKKPTILANVILLGVVVVLIVAVLGGGWLATKKLLAKLKQPAPVVATSRPAPASKTEPGAPAEAPAPKTTVERPGILERPSLAQESATAKTIEPAEAPSREVAKSDSTTAVEPAKSASTNTVAAVDDTKLPGSIPGTTPGATSPAVTASTDPDVTTTTPNTAIPARAATRPPSDDPTDALPSESASLEVPAQKEEEVTVFREDSPEVRALKEDADRRIEEAPADLYPDREKSRVRTALRNAKRLARVATLHFAPGASRLGRGEEARLKKALASREAAELMEDTEAAVVCIGFADQSGDPQRNKELSKQRAMGAINLLKKLGVPNVTYPVAIGGTELVASGNKDKNRAVEVWIVLP